MFKTLPLSSYNLKIDLKENNYIILINMKFILTIYKFDINGMIYIGSSWDFDRRKIKHKNTCYNEKSRDYNYQVYKYIRDNNIDWNDITIEDINTHELDEKNDLFKRQTEQKFIEKYDSKNKGLNTRNAYITDEQKKEQMKEYHENHKEELKEYHKEYQKKHYENNKEEIKEIRKEYKKNHKEQIKEQNRNSQKKYREKHKEEINKKHRLRYQHKKNVKICNEIVNELIDSLF